MDYYRIIYFLNNAILWPVATMSDLSASHVLTPFEAPVFFQGLSSHMYSVC